MTANRPIRRPITPPGAPRSRGFGNADERAAESHLPLWCGRTARAAIAGIRDRPPLRLFLLQTARGRCGFGASRPVGDRAGGRKTTPLPIGHRDRETLLLQDLRDLYASPAPLVPD